MEKLKRIYNLINQTIRKQLFDKIMTSRQITDLREKGIPERDSISSVKARAVGFNSRGNFQVHRERVEGSKVIWQRHYSKGCPELLEYVARFNIATGSSHSVKPEDYIKGIKRGELVYNVFVPELLTAKAPEGDCSKAAEFREWLRQLPNWEELYTPNGYNFVAIVYLYNLVTGGNIPLDPPVIMHICDSYDSPYKIRFCQGVPSKAGSNDDWPELYKYEIMKLVGGDTAESPHDPYAEPNLLAVARPTCPLVDLIHDLEDELAEAKLEAAKDKLLEGLSFLLPSELASKVAVPDTMEGVQDMQAKVDRATDLHIELASYKKTTTKGWI